MESPYDYTYNCTYERFDILLMFDPMRPPQTHYKILGWDKTEMGSGPYRSKDKAIERAKELIDRLVFGPHAPR